MTAETPGGGGLTEASLESRLLEVLMDEYGGDPEDWTGMRSLKRVTAVAAAAAVQARAEVVARVEALADEWDVLGSTSYRESRVIGEHVRQLRAALAGPNPRDNQDS